ncbi:thiamine phosphate synthase [Yunchengibacter salinarum]|uniref:thiamine phosphate synthase n=1 Tax=Yunchengibacter salinarum TaxID=3133399 RepID=UPI0035B69C98
MRQILITDAARQGDPAVLAARLPRGSLVLLRDYEAPDRRARATRLAALARQRGLYLLIAADHHLACHVGAAGVHLPGRQLWAPDPAVLAAHRAGRLWLTAACHDGRDLARAGALHVDMAILSPVFPTRSHPGGRVLGLHRFARLARSSPVPVAALGGIGAVGARRLKAVPGVVAVAGIDGFPLA